MDDVLYEEFKGGIRGPLDQCVGVFFFLFALLGAIVCLVHRRQSPWLLLAMSGFLGELFAGILQWWVSLVVPLMVLRGSLSVGEYFWMWFLIRLLVMLAFAIIVGGLTFALRDIQRKQAAVPPDGKGPRFPGPLPAAGELFTPRKEGSPDIQP